MLRMDAMRPRACNRRTSARSRDAYLLRAHPTDARNLRQNS
jgi:hypothetical protein